MKKLIDLTETDNSIAGNAISFIDIDETTFHTFAKIGVYDKDNNLVTKLNNQEFNTHNLENGHHYDFSEFRDSKIFNKTSKPIDLMIKKIKKLIDCIKIHGKQEKVIFLTARADFKDKDLFLKTFRQNGIDIDDASVYVERTGNLTNIKNVADRKRYVILKYLKTGNYSAVRMYDDDNINLITFSELGKEINSGKYGILKAVQQKYPKVKKIFFFPLKVKEDGRVSKLTESVLMEGKTQVRKNYPKINDSDFEKLIKLDPTYSGGEQLGKYTKWILNLYNNFVKDKLAYEKWEEMEKQGKHFPEPVRKTQEKLEDFDKIPSLLKTFDAVKNKAKLNIENIKSISDLYQAVTNATKSEDISENKSVQHGINLFKKSVEKGGKVVFKNKKWVILVPKTLESSVVFGNDTNWCTTSPNGEMYKRYTKEGPLYINLDLENGELYQFNFETNSFMDKNDREISLKKFIFNAGEEVYNFYKNNTSFPDRELYDLKFHKDSIKDEDISFMNYSDVMEYGILNLSFNSQKMFILLHPNCIEDGYKKSSWFKGDLEKYNFTNEELISMIGRCSNIIKYIKNPTDLMKLTAIQYNNGSDTEDLMKYLDTPFLQKSYLINTRYGIQDFPDLPDLSDDFLNHVVRTLSADDVKQIRWNHRSEISNTNIEKLYNALKNDNKRKLSSILKTKINRVKKELEKEDKEN